MRAQISNYLALTYEPEGYMNPKNFISKQTKDGSEVELMEDDVTPLPSISPPAKLYSTTLKFH